MDSFFLTNILLKPSVMWVLTWSRWADKALFRLAASLFFKLSKIFACSFNELSITPSSTKLRVYFRSSISNYGKLRGQNYGDTLLNCSELRYLIKQVGSPPDLLNLNSQEMPNYPALPAPAPSHPRLPFRPIFQSYQLTGKAPILGRLYDVVD